MRSRRGSSPLARGLRRRTPQRSPADRIIPARAGFTRSSRWEPAARTDHPRSRGVYTGGVKGRDGKRGSSPLARGLRDPAEISAAPTGIIPARAGFTAWNWVSAARSPDHPRSRGVYNRNQLQTSHAAGSSPLARGLLPYNLRGKVPSRIIPARAGFTCIVRRRGSLERDHPRSRGVYKGHQGHGVVRTGSSPLARGLLNEDVAPPVGDGIIPARAGFTRSVGRGPPATADHPRSRGVYGGSGGFGRSLCGSSPLARGLLEYIAIRRYELRIIPARAGFTCIGA